MRRSQDRILVSHAGTLPRPDALSNLQGGSDEEVVSAAVRELVGRQAEIGIDIVNDGEVPKQGSFLSYMRTRISGCEARPRAGGTTPGRRRHRWAGGSLT